MAYKIVRTIFFIFRELLCTTILGLRITSCIKGYNHLIVNDKTKICIEGFPRSANTRAVAIANQKIEINYIARHTHSVGQLKAAIKSKKRIIFIVREPYSSIASLKIRRPNILMYALVWQYIILYKYVLKNLGFINVVHFENIIKEDESSDLQIISENIDFEKINAAVEKMEMEDSGGEVRETHVARPSEKRKNKADEIIQELKRLKISKNAEMLYEEICRKI